MPALTPKELRAIIYVRIGVAETTLDVRYRTRLFGQIQGLIYALTGKFVQMSDTTLTASLFKTCGIPFTENADGVLETPDEWMKDHGFDPEKPGSDIYGDHHPRFSKPW